jgi:hydrogenase expression/formation protein HypC
MCLAAPAAVISVEGDTALVDVDGVRLSVSRMLMPDIQPGDAALVHVGFILAKIDADEAQATLSALRGAGLSASEGRA